jgi:hypothetical protein
MKTSLRITMSGQCVAGNDLVFLAEGFAMLIGGSGWWIAAKAIPFGYRA